MRSSIFDLMTAHVNITSLDGGEGLREMAYSIANGRDVHITITDGKGNDETYDVDLEGEVFDTNMNQILIDINPTDFISNTNDEGKYFKRRSEHRVYGSTVVDISIHPPSFKPASLSLSRSPLF